MDIQSIKPQVNGVCDKYSWNLYNWIKTNQSKGSPLRVFATGWNWLHGLMPIDPLEYDNQDLLIGWNDGDFPSGGMIRSIMQGQRGYLQPVAYTTPFNLVDITDRFWLDYQDKGRCIFGDHFHEWIRINSHSRKCAYCGQHQTRTVWTQTIRRRVEDWK